MAGLSGGTSGSRIVLSRQAYRIAGGWGLMGGISKINWNPEAERIGVFRDNRTDDLYNSQTGSKWEAQASTK
jgi:hypothetical protein